MRPRTVPGVVVCDGAAAGCEAFVERIRALRWQAMHERWARTRDEPPTPASEQTPPPLSERAPPAAMLPSPFRELDEGAMGEAAALCEAGARSPRGLEACHAAHPD